MNRSIRDNLVMGLKTKPGELQIHQACKVTIRLHHARMASACKTIFQIAQIHDHIDSLPDKYDTLCGQRGSSLSGGQQQRLVIARALLRQPVLLLLDEATSALDTETEDAVVSALDRWKDDNGATLVVISHRNRSFKNCDEVLE
jgi:ABC-type multidrug transport system fused ATPase/permease subunit